MIPVYLANTDNSFNQVMLYNGYLPTSHEGLIDTIEAVEPFTTPAMVFSGENDQWFKDMAPALAANSLVHWTCIAKLLDTIYPMKTTSILIQSLRSFAKESLSTTQRNRKLYC